MEVKKIVICRHVGLPLSLNSGCMPVDLHSKHNVSLEHPEPVWCSVKASGKEPGSHEHLNLTSDDTLSLERPA